MLKLSKPKVFLPVTLILSLCVMGTASCGKSDASLSIEESNSRVAQSAVHVAAVGLSAMLEDVTDETHRIEIIRSFIDPIRFFNDESGYFYVYDYDCVNVAHAIDKTLVGKDLTGYTDINGLQVIQKLRDAAENGGGFVTFYWPHPQTKEEMRKIGYVEPISGTDYFIGAGYYPDAE